MAARESRLRRLDRARRTPPMSPGAWQPPPPPYRPPINKPSSQGLAIASMIDGHCRRGSGRLLWAGSRDCGADNGIDCVVADKKGAGQVWRKTVCYRRVIIGAVSIAFYLCSILLVSLWMGFG